ncbi:hypothetical protein FRC11_006967 [Ceratobasidium sp. 423]|nr:hypothetical protein FRC11_006967 [Ceratobasidium sp. 423]
MEDITKSIIRLAVSDPNDQGDVSMATAGTNDPDANADTDSDANMNEHILPPDLTTSPMPSTQSHLTHASVPPGSVSAGGNMADLADLQAKLQHLASHPAEERTCFLPHIQILLAGLSTLSSTGLVASNLALPPISGHFPSGIQPPHHAGYHASARTSMSPPPSASVCPPAPIHTATSTQAPASAPTNKPKPPHAGAPASAPTSMLSKPMPPTSTTTPPNPAPALMPKAKHIPRRGARFKSIDQLKARPSTPTTLHIDDDRSLSDASVGVSNHPIRLGHGMAVASQGQGATGIGTGAPPTRTTRTTCKDAAEAKVAGQAKATHGIGRGAPVITEANATTGSKPIP